MRLQHFNFNGTITRQRVLMFAWAVLAPAVLWAATLGLSTDAQAHEISPAIVDISFEDRAVTLDIELNLEALVARIGPEHANTNDSPNAAEYDALRLMEPDALADALDAFLPDFLSGLSLWADDQALDPGFVDVTIPAVGDPSVARLSTLQVSAALPGGSDTFIFGWTESFGAVVVRAEPPGAEEEVYSAYLLPGEQSGPINIQGATIRNFFEVVADYIVIGFLHIVPKGIDHILFVVGIFLASTHLRPLLWQVSAFTVAHTVSLALGILGIVNVSPGIVEPLIALSIAYVCVENIIFKRMTVWRPAIVFGFGLLHGLGFAGVLREVGLPASEFITGLISFNVGVELGQLAVIAVCYALVGFWFGRRANYRTTVVIPISALVGAIGLFWFVERIVAA